MRLDPGPKLVKNNLSDDLHRAYLLLSWVPEPQNQKEIENFEKEEERKKGGYYCLSFFILLILLICGSGTQGNLLPNYMRSSVAF